MVQIKTDAPIEAMRETGRVVAQILTAARQAATVGVSPRELDEVAREVLREAGAGSRFLNYRPHFAPTPHDRRQPRRARRAHGGDHRRRPAHPWAAGARVTAASRAAPEAAARASVR